MIYNLACHLFRASVAVVLATFFQAAIGYQGSVVLVLR